MKTFYKSECILNDQDITAYVTDVRIESDILSHYWRYYISFNIPSDMIILINEMKFGSVFNLSISTIRDNIAIEYFNTKLLIVNNDFDFNLVVNKNTTGSFSNAYNRVNINAISLDAFKKSSNTITGVFSSITTSDLIEKISLLSGFKSVVYDKTTFKDTKIEQILIPNLSVVDSIDYINTYFPFHTGKVYTFVESPKYLLDTSITGHDENKILYIRNVNSLFKNKNELIFYMVSPQSSNSDKHDDIDNYETTYNIYQQNFSVNSTLNKFMLENRYHQNVMKFDMTEYPTTVKYDIMNILKVYGFTDGQIQYDTNNLNIDRNKSIMNFQPLVNHDSAFESEIIRQNVYMNSFDVVKSDYFCYKIIPSTIVNIYGDSEQTIKIGGKYVIMALIRDYKLFGYSHENSTFKATIKLGRTNFYKKLSR